MTFDELIQGIDSGAFNEVVTSGLRDLVQTLQKRADADGGVTKGELKLAFKFACGANGRMEIEAGCDIKSPGLRKSKETRWVKGHDLATQDPRQDELPKLRTPAREAH